MTDSPVRESIEAEAERLVTLLRSSQAAKSRLAHTERVWFYRTYQGGEAYSAIDWRQSGRTDEILVREHEPLSHRKILFQFAPAGLPPSRRRDAEGAVLTLALLLTSAERPVFFQQPLGKGLLARQPVIEVWAQVRASLPDQAAHPEMPLAPFHRGCLIAMADFNSAPAVWHESVKKLCDNNVQGLMVQIGKPLSADLPLRALTKNLDWPLIVWNDNQTPDDILPELYALALKQSL